MNRDGDAPPRRTPTAARPPRDPAGETPRARPRAGVAPVDAPDPSVRVVAAVAIRAGRRVLVIREEDEPHRHSWVLPQGYPRPGEPLARAASREAYEEVGLDVHIDRLLGVYERFDADGGGAPIRWVTVAYLGRLVRDGAPVATREAIDSAWIEPERIDAGSMPALVPLREDLVRALRA